MIVITEGEGGKEFDLLMKLLFNFKEKKLSDANAF